MATSPARTPQKSRPSSSDIDENDMTRTSSVCTVEVSPGEVDAGADITLKGEVSCSPARDLRGKTLLIKDQDGAQAANVELTEFDGETNQTSEFVVAAPTKPGAYTWLAAYGADPTPDASYEDTLASFSFTVKPHSTRVVVWDTPSAIECGKKFNIKFGVKCSSGCRSDGWGLEVRDHDGKKLASAAFSDDAWPDTAALYYAEVDLTAPDTEGLYRWEAKAPTASLDIPHAEGIASFNVRVVPTPECVLTVEAIDMESQTPIQGAKVVVHPYRAFTDERGVAEVKVPTGEYRLFVSGKNYFPFRSDGEVKTDVTIRAELDLDLGLSDADVWS
jgi:hypothetical protein